MIFSNKGAVKPQIDLYIDVHKITESSETKFLGVFIDSNLICKYHINYISGKIAKGIGIITKARRLLDKESLVALYYTYAIVIMFGVIHLCRTWISCIRCKRKLLE